jgi:hypothetical protein
VVREARAREEGQGVCEGDLAVDKGEHHHWRTCRAEKDEEAEGGGDLESGGKP